MILNKTQLYFDLYDAFICAKRHKSNKSYVIEFEKNLKGNLMELVNELFDRRYIPKPCMCFIVEEPKKREIFAANFRDRIVHHLYYNYTYDLFDSTFIEDSYSCRKGKGTHYGIHRLGKHIRQETENYTKEAYVLKMDIKGYFIHINRLILLRIVNDTLDKMESHKVKGERITWGEKLDYDFVKYLGEVIITLDPTKNCVIKGGKKSWMGLSDSKSLFKTEHDCGLPIGNLTSQLFSNVYLNKLDQFVKSELKCKHYGRYVDDFYVVSKDRLFIRSLIPLVEKFLKERLHLDVSKGKTKIISCRFGVEFLGNFIKPYRKYVSNSTFKRIKMRISKMEFYGYDKDIEMSLNSILGVFKHCSSFKLRKRLFDKLKNIKRIGYFNNDYSKFIKFTR